MKENKRTGVSRGTEARDLKKINQEFLSWKFGMFIHFNMSTFVAGGWATGKEDPLLFNPTEIDFGQWADAAKSAKMKYAILTIKHTGGYCLWESSTTDHDITMFKNYKNGTGDIVKEFVEAFRARDLKVGLYYCFPLWGEEWKDYMTLPAEDYALGNVDALSLIKAHFTELLTQYGEIDLVWIDQSSSINGGLKPGDWGRIKAHIHSLQPSCIVIANSESNFDYTDIYGHEYPYSLELPPLGNTTPTEVCDKLNLGWFADPEHPAVPIRSVDYVVNKLLRPLNDNQANFLLNCAPEKRGLLHEETVEFLKQVGEIWDPSEPSHAEDELYGMTRSPILNVPSRSPKVALTFGPEWALDDLQHASEVLAVHQAQGTFFVNEAVAKHKKEELRKWVAAGNELGNGSKSEQVITGMENARQVDEHVDAVQNQLRDVQSPVMFRAPKYQYDEFTWPVLNYHGLIAIESCGPLAPGAILDVKTLVELGPLLSELEKKGLVAVTVSELFLSSTSKRLRVAAIGGMDVMTGRE